MASNTVPEIAEKAVLVKSTPITGNPDTVKGYQWSTGAVNYDKLLDSYLTSGFQATNFGQAVLETRKMVHYVRVNVGLIR